MKLKNSKRVIEYIKSFFIFVFFLSLFTLEKTGFYLKLIDLLLIFLFISLRKKRIDKRVLNSIFVFSIYTLFIIYRADVRVESYFFFNYLLLFLMLLFIDFEKEIILKAIKPMFFGLLLSQLFFLISGGEYSNLFFKNHSLFAFVILWIGILILEREKNSKKNFIFYSALIFLSVFLTYSKTGIIFFSLYFVYLFYKMFKIEKKRFIALFSTLLFFVAIFTAKKAKEDPFLKGRIGIWKTGVKVFLAHPVFGVGPFNFTHYSDEFIEPVFKREKRELSQFYRDFISGKEKLKVFYIKRVNDPHNILIQIFSELGIIGFTLVLITGFYIKKEIEIKNIFEKGILILILTFSMLHNFSFSYAFFILSSISISILIKAESEKPLNLKISLIFFVYIFLFFLPEILNSNLSPFSYAKVKSSAETFKMAFLKEKKPMYAVLGLENYNWLCSFNKRDYNVYYGMASIYDELFNLTKNPNYRKLFLRAIRNAHRIKPKSVFPLFYEAYFYYKTSEFSHALNSIERALYLEPFFYKGIELKVDVLESLNKNNDELKLLKQVLKKLKKKREVYKPVGSGRYEKEILF